MINNTNEEDSLDQPDYQESVAVSRHIRMRYTSLGFDEVVANTKQSLMEEGFDIVTEFAFHDYLRQQLTRDVNRCLLLGACNPELVRQLLQGEDRISDSMLCHVIIQDAEDGESVQVSIIDPSEPYNNDHPFDYEC